MMMRLEAIVRYSSQRHCVSSTPDPAASQTGWAVKMQAPYVAKSEVVIRRLAYVAGLAGPLAALPQAISIWMTHKADGVSFWSALGLTVVAAIWLAYGVVLRQRPLVVSSLLWLMLDLGIVSGVWRYGHF
jgi:uncharacterized protein with PQ loop repeat